MIQGIKELELHDKERVNVPTIHELAHREYEEQSKTIQSSEMNSLDAQLLKLPIICRIPYKKILLPRVLHEVIAHTVQYCYTGVHENMPPVRFRDLARNSVRRLEREISKLPRIGLLGEFEESLVNMYLQYLKKSYPYTRLIGKYLANKYENTTDLWNKLEKLRTLTDLKRLINENS